VAMPVHEDGGHGSRARSQMIPLTCVPSYFMATPIKLFIHRTVQESSGVPSLVRASNARKPARLPDGPTHGR